MENLNFRKIKISPSLLSANKAYLGDEIQKIFSADAVHWDIMDGNFVDTITFGFDTIKDCRKISDLRFDVHLMVQNPEKYFEGLKEVGADFIIIHSESTIHLHKNLEKIKKFGLLSGVAFNPATSTSSFKYIKDITDMVLIMSVNPGSSGQKFIPSVLKKISKIRSLSSDVEICVDGGMNKETIKLCFDEGADNFVSGAYIFNSKNYKTAIEELKTSIYG